MSKAAFIGFISALTMAWSGLALGAPKNKCSTDHPNTVYLAASCINGSCLGHKSFHFVEDEHRLACSQQVRFAVTNLDKEDQALALTILRSMKRRDGAFVAEIEPKTSKNCTVKGGSFCLKDNIIKIRSAAVNPGSAIIVDNLSNALARKQHTDEGLLLGEIFYLAQVVFSSFAILILGSFLISHEKRRLIAGILTMAYMSIFIYLYGMEAFFVRIDAVPLINAGMLAIMAVCVFAAARGMLADLSGGFKKALQGAILLSELVLCVFLLYSPALDLVTVAYGLFYIGIPTMLIGYSIGCTVVSLKDDGRQEIMDEGPSFSFG